MYHQTARVTGDKSEVYVSLSLHGADEKWVVVAG
jgi:hypothetical protein